MIPVQLPPALTRDLERVDQIIAERTGARQVVAGIAGRHLGDGEGRLRAALLLLAARVGGETPERALHAAAAVMLIYAASQVHDELVDAADRRRGTVGRHARWGGSATLMVGDYLLALAAAEMALAPDPSIITFYSRSVMAISEGRLSPVTEAAPLDVAHAQYVQHADSTTGALVAAATGAGAVCAALPPSQVDALVRFGRELGVAMRMASDARDYEGPGEALRASVITLPLIYALDAGGEALAALLEQPADEAAIADALALARRIGGVDRARAEARVHARRAAAHLEALPATPARDALRAIAEAVA